jgi:prepilin-type N-terminal cleavage/methylation domain-containing protein
MKKVQQGFTLIELMIVVAIIGILAAVAIPSYQDYTKRAHVSEGFGLAGAAKTSVSEYYASEGTWPTDNSTAGLATATSINGNAVTSVGVATGVITITYNTKVDTAATTVSLTPNDTGGGITWTCAGSVPSKLRPANCRN